MVRPWLPGREGHAGIPPTPGRRPSSWRSGRAGGAALAAGGMGRALQPRSASCRHDEAAIVAYSSGYGGEGPRSSAPAARLGGAQRPRRVLRAHPIKIAAFHRFFRAEPASSPKARPRGAPARPCCALACPGAPPRAFAPRWRGGGVVGIKTAALRRVFRSPEPASLSARSPSARARGRRAAAHPVVPGSKGEALAAHWLRTDMCWCALQGALLVLAR